MTYNCAFTLGFSVPNCPNADGTGLTKQQFYNAISKRIADLYALDEFYEACGEAYDAYEEADD